MALSPETLTLEVPKRRGRPKGSKNRTTITRRRATTRQVSVPRERMPLSDADVISNRIQEVRAENAQLQARVLELESGWKQIEAALSGKPVARRMVTADDEVSEN